MSAFVREAIAKEIERREASQKAQGVGKERPDYRTSGLPWPNATVPKSVPREAATLGKSFPRNMFRENISEPDPVSPLGTPCGSAGSMGSGRPR
jgi:hypothetical protein